MTALATIIRCSALSWWPDCPRRSAARLLWREIAAAGFKLRTTPRGVGAAIGTAVHKAAEVTLKEKATSGRLPPVSVAADCAAETLDEQVRDGLQYDQTTTNRTHAEVQAVAMSRAWHRVIAPAIEPVIVEERLEAEVAPGLVLSGQPDTIAREPGRVRDLKTTTRPGASHAPQLGGYALLARSNGLDIDAAAIDELKRVAIGKAQPDPVSHPVAIAQAETAAANIVRMIERDLFTFRHGDAERHILPGDPWSFAANPNSMLCSARYCEAWGTEFCREWRSRESQ